MCISLRFVFLKGRVFTRSRAANTVPVLPPVSASINVFSADYDTASSQTDSSGSILSDYQNLYDPQEHQSQAVQVIGKLKTTLIYLNVCTKYLFFISDSINSVSRELNSNTEPSRTTAQNHIV